MLILLPRSVRSMVSLRAPLTCRKKGLGVLSPRRLRARGGSGSVSRVWTVFPAPDGSRRLQTTLAATVPARFRLQKSRSRRSPAFLSPEVVLLPHCHTCLGVPHRAAAAVCCKCLTHRVFAGGMFLRHVGLAYFSDSQCRCRGSHAPGSSRGGDAQENLAYTT